MKPTLALITLAVLLLVAGCHSEIPTSTERPPHESPTPISSSEQVVKLDAPETTITYAGPGEATVTLSISPGFHVNANPPSMTYLIATELQPGKLDGVTSGKPVYPSALMKKFQFDKNPLAVYEGRAVIKLPLRATAGSPTGKRSLPIKVRVQACDDEKCYAPATVEGSIPITVTVF